MTLDKNNPHFKLLRNLMVRVKDSELNEYGRAKKTKQRRDSINNFFERSDNWEETLSED